MENFCFELCAESLDAAKAAESGGADRIELCANLSIGGLTPSLELMRATTGALSLPVHVLIRPRGGNFTYSEEEFLLMRHQIEQAKSLGAAGVVVGVLHQDGRVDINRSRTLVELAYPMKTTFHRAFDETPQLNEALEAVAQTGAEFLLTSGGEADVLTGAAAIGRLRQQAGELLQVMAGGGLTLKNLPEVAQQSGVSCLHGSLMRRHGVLGKGENGVTADSGGVSVWEMLEADVRQAVALFRRQRKLQAVC